MTFLRAFFAAALGLAGAFLLLGLYLGPVAGDLTRLANLPERGFGERAAQPVIHVRASPNKAVAPTVVVLGDSFSEHNLWQSVVMADTRHEFITFDWNSFREPSCLEPWIASLKTHYPTIKLVILQTAERELLERFRSPRPCRRGAPLEPRPVAESLTLAASGFDFGTAFPDPLYAIRATFNLERRFDEPTLIDDVYVAPLTRGDLFSNRRSNLLLYYRFDDYKRDWTADRMRAVASQLRNLDEVSDRHGMQFLMLVIPDKSTIYAPFLKTPLYSVTPPDAWLAFDAAGIPQVSPKATLRAFAVAHQDTYRPNDTHFGNAGYEVIGHLVRDRIRTLAAKAEP